MGRSIGAAGPEVAAALGRGELLPGRCCRAGAQAHFFPRWTTRRSRRWPVSRSPGRKAPSAASRWATSRGWPCHVPAYKSRIGPAFSAKRGSRGKIQYRYCQGLMASPSRMRHTLLRLIGLPSARQARSVTSASDWRLSGCLVWATNSHAAAFTKAWSSGGKMGLATPPGDIGHGEVPCGPAPPPSLDLPPRQADAPPGLFVCQVGVVVQQEHQLRALDGLVRGRAAPNRLAGLLQKAVREGRAARGGRSRHARHPVGQRLTINAAVDRL